MLSDVVHQEDPTELALPPCDLHQTQIPSMSARMVTQPQLARLLLHHKQGSLEWL